MLLVGTLPATALLNLDELNLLGMIGGLGPSGVLKRLGLHTLLSGSYTHSWFITVRHITQKYTLQYPLLVLQ